MTVIGKRVAIELSDVLKRDHNVDVSFERKASRDGFTSVARLTFWTFDEADRDLERPGDSTHVDTFYDVEDDGCVILKLWSDADDLEACAAVATLIGLLEDYGIPYAVSTTIF